jgi:transcriptional regulator with XRE-family HTH domain
MLHNGQKKYTLLICARCTKKGCDKMFFERVSLLCKENHEKLTPLTVKLGHSPGSIGNWKNGTIPSGEIVKSFADHFNVTTDYLLGRTEAKTAPNEQSLSPEQQELLSSTDDLSAENRLKVLEYSELLRKSQNS